MSIIVSDTLFNLFAVFFFSSNLPAAVGKHFVVFIISVISIFTFLGITNNPSEAINISLIVIIGTVLPFATYVSIAFPTQKPIITPILPSLFNIPAIIPDIAYDATSIGSAELIIPNTIPIVIPAVPPTSIPFFQPKNNTIIILNIFVIESPNICNLLNAHRAIDINKLAPITSSIENAFFIPYFVITINEFEKIL